MFVTLRYLNILIADDICYVVNKISYRCDLGLMLVQATIIKHWTRLRTICSENCQSCGITYPSKPVKAEASKTNCIMHVCTPSSWSGVTNFKTVLASRSLC